MSCYKLRSLLILLPAGPPVLAVVLAYYVWPISLFAAAGLPVRRGTLRVHLEGGGYGSTRDRVITTLQCECGTRVVAAESAKPPPLNRP